MKRVKLNMEAIHNCLRHGHKVTIAKRMDYSVVTFNNHLDRGRFHLDELNAIAEIAGKDVEDFITFEDVQEVSDSAQ